MLLSLVADLKPDFNPLIVSEDVVLPSVSLPLSLHSGWWYGGPEAQNSLRKQIK